MNAYRWGVNLKLGLIAMAMMIALGSLWYTNSLANRLQANEAAVVELYASAIKHLYESQITSLNPHQGELREIEELLVRRGGSAVSLAGDRIDEESLARYREALSWARSMPPADQTSFVFNEIIATRRFGIPAITTDQELTEVSAYNNIEIPALPTAADTTRFLLDAAKSMTRFTPFPVKLEIDGQVVLSQLVHYGESEMIRALRILPFVQLFFVGLFILVGYLGFSYVRRSEQNSLWVGMAKEAAHQLGTPISSMMGWAEVLSSMEDKAVSDVAGEMGKDIGRLQRVASRFSKIGSRPDLKETELEPVLQEVAAYMRRRMPRHGKEVHLDVSAPAGVSIPLNTELFEWVIENLVKNALDALEGMEGGISVEAAVSPTHAVIEVSDTGKGIEKRDWKNVFRPGFSTKKRGWGLGLSLSRRIIEDYHGGRLVLASSRPGEGSTFRITLPRQTR